jgi:hypothetical protein
VGNLGSGSKPFCGFRGAAGSPGRVGSVKSALHLLLVSCHRLPVHPECDQSLGRFCQGNPSPMCHLCSETRFKFALLWVPVPLDTWALSYLGLSLSICKIQVLMLSSRMVRGLHKVLSMQVLAHGPTYQGTMAQPHAPHPQAHSRPLCKQRDRQVHQLP